MCTSSSDDPYSPIGLPFKRTKVRSAGPPAADFGSQSRQKLPRLLRIAERPGLTALNPCISGGGWVGWWEAGDTGIFWLYNGFFRDDASRKSENGKSLGKFLLGDDVEIVVIHLNHLFFLPYVRFLRII